MFNNWNNKSTINQLSICLQQYTLSFASVNVLYIIYMYIYITINTYFIK